MQQEPEKLTWQQQAMKSLWTFLTVAAAILFYYLIQYLGQISSFVGAILSGLSPVIWGLIIAYLLDPVVGFYQRKLRRMMFQKQPPSEKSQRIIRSLAAILTLLSAIATLIILGFLIVPELSNSISGIVKELPSQIDSLMTQLENKTIFDNHLAFGRYANENLLNLLQSLETWLKSDLPSQANVIFEYFYAGVRNVFSIVYNLIIGMILSVYIAIDKERLLRQVQQITYSLFPVNTAKHLRKRLGHANEKFSSAIRGKLLDSMIIGLICFFMLLLLNTLPFLDFPYPVLLAVIVGMTNVVPFFGPFVGAFITGVLVLFDNPRMVIPYLIWILILQQFDCNYLDPHIVGGSVGLRPFWSIFACLLGSAIFGVPGFVIGPPIFAFIYELVSEWSEDKIRHKNMAEAFNLPPEEEFNDFAEPEEPEDPPREPLHVQISATKEKLKQELQKRKKQ